MKQNRVYDACGPLERMTPAEAVRELRKETGLSQPKFGAKYGIPANTIRTWEYGHAAPPAYLLRALSLIVREDLKGGRV